MACRVVPPAITISVGLLCALVMEEVPAQAESVARARLVQCGADSCLRLSGRRAHPDIAVRVNGRHLPVKGERAWQVTVPLSTARTWPIERGYAIALTQVDSRTGTERTQAVALPPGSLGSRLELASLVVRAH